MHFWHSALRLALLASAALQSGAQSTWAYTDATVSVQTKGTGVGAGLKEQYGDDSTAAGVYSNRYRNRIPDNKPLSKLVSLGDADNLKLALTSQEGRTQKRAHQTFLLLNDPETGLDIAYPFTVKENGKSRLELVLPSDHATTAANTIVDTKRPPDPIPLRLRAG